MVNYDRENEPEREPYREYRGEDYSIGGPLVLTILGVFVVGMLIYAFVGTTDMRARYRTDPINRVPADTDVNRPSNQPLAP